MNLSTNKRQIVARCTRGRNVFAFLSARARRAEPAAEQKPRSIQARFDPTCKVNRIGEPPMESYRASAAVHRIHCPAVP